MQFPLWAKVLLWLEVPLVFVMDLWYTPYAILLAWGIPLLWNRWIEHLETVEALAYFARPEQEPTQADEERA